MRISISKNEHFTRDIRKKWEWKLPKRAFWTRHSQKVRMKASKTSVLHETFTKSESEGFRNERFTRDIRKNWKTLPACCILQNLCEYEPLACTTFQCAGHSKNVISPAFGAFDTHDLRRGLTFVVLQRRHARLKKKLKEEREDPQMWDAADVKMSKDVDVQMWRWAKM